ncbi:bifunctional methylenetetrahydrofolate dehydrogenase/methenyltetrahydrofolate cyclohydrolase FolD [Caminibacter pacificus]|uniref:Bifunctional protein FolD n=1 Tax=Caminibacter pacificus TaxID=1424653 RepID=A0AAJ4RCN0_9BACT|nr:bifunctional methylenetetrahydrofolate dehydrogenase/methenyltetrahydrofolate cyclohydrolase FolD [Caminibacter pacificus]NPA87658.1 bifunctional methylenetetrahydrofolate dehydrogenase/methenyltetrahydrofolate cyclohydrolase FolD [Campylobacterota bacterium]QCI27928.1 bifunctional methylenetetrahydrofolate dehydrogenase/methenyltetrahydrofolate cyclohydrolase FolD [Caminibacter pacificus]ROR39894.1 methylenetetrahydrofolate dehydrogenase (NADP+)/methenyltetrahydrofolate cyclohydrolase [Camin
MTILDGKKLSNKIKEELRGEVEELKAKGITPGLAVILVGNDPASHVYVKMKRDACQDVGIYSVVHEFPENITEKELLSTIDMINENPNIHGLLIQLPLPKHIDTTKILERVSPKKDVDGFHPYNMGRLVEGLDTFAPCTPLGVMELFKEYDIDLVGKDVCVVGASNIVGKPMWALLVNAWATVDICHIETRDLAAHTKRADIVIVGVGKPNLITEDMVKDGVIVVDIGINRLPSGKLVGDVDFENVSKKASYITPVPGGVGPMTIAMLLKNTVKAAKNFAKEVK